MRKRVLVVAAGCYCTSNDRNAMPKRFLMCKPTTPSLSIFDSIRQSLGGKQETKGERLQRQSAFRKVFGSVVSEAAEGFGSSDNGLPLSSIGTANVTSASQAQSRGGGATGGNSGGNVVGGRLDQEKSFHPGTSAVPLTKLDSLFYDLEKRDSMLIAEEEELQSTQSGRSKKLKKNRRPISYEVQALRAAEERKVKEAVDKKEHDQQFDSLNMPRDGDNPNRRRAEWEYTPTPEHKALVLLLYRQLLKGLVDFKSVRRRSLIYYARTITRRRSQATEKLLIDECIEEMRRAIYVIQKNHNFTKTKEYEFDAMSMPKDTGQDVKTYMEEVYDPEVSRMQFSNITDVVPGQEDKHAQNLSPASGQHHFKDSKLGGGGADGSFKIQIKDEDMQRRPPPPPTFMQKKQ